MGGALHGLLACKAWKAGSYSDTNGGRTAVQIGGVLQYIVLLWSLRKHQKTSRTLGEDAPRVCSR